MKPLRQTLDVLSSETRNAVKDRSFVCTEPYDKPSNALKRFLKKPDRAREEDSHALCGDSIGI